MRFVHAIQGDATQTTERVQEVIRQYREIRVLHICFVRLRQLTSNIQFSYLVYVRVIIGGYQNF
jgi:hypothetical protein